MSILAIAWDAKAFYGQTLLVITTRMSSAGFCTPVPGIMPGNFHVPLAGPISHRLIIAVPKAIISFSAKVRPLHIPAPEPQGFSFPYRATDLPVSVSDCMERSDTNLSGFVYTDGSCCASESGTVMKVPGLSLWVYAPSLIVMGCLMYLIDATSIAIR